MSDIFQKTYFSIQSKKKVNGSIKEYQFYDFDDYISPQFGFSNQ